MAYSCMTLALVTIVVIGLTLVTTVTSKGNFFIGLLKYDNIGNLDNTGNCCDGNLDPRGTCTDVCDLIFEITVTGLGRYLQRQQWSTEPVSGESISSFSHPVSFNFTRWPDEVNVTVDVYDRDDDTIGTYRRHKVDQFHTVFTHQGAELFYILQPLKGQRSINASMLTILFRYKCDPTLGPSCFTDCVDHTDDEICPTLPPFTGTFQTATDPYCEHTGNNSGNCSAIAVTTQSPSETSSETSISNVNISTKRVYLDSGNNSKNQTMTMTNHASVNTNQQTTSAKVAIETSTALSSVSTTITSTKTKSSTKIINVSVQETIPGTSLTTTIDPPVGTPPTVKNDDDGGMTYWPAIVGGVLGGLALLAAAGFLVYYNRQKKLQKRQEIYNVNPKILRKFEEYTTENGTSGRADVPLETEQV